MLPNNFPLSHPYQAPDTTIPISDPDISPLPLPGVSESQVAQLFEDDAQESDPKYLPGPSHTNPSPVPKSSASGR